MERFDQIQAYLEDTLTSGQKFHFEEELQKNTALSSAVRLFTTTTQIYDVLMEESIRDEILKAHSSAGWRMPRLFSLKIDYKRAISLAAAILFLIVVSTSWYANSHATNAALVSAYFDPPNVSGLRGASASLDLLSTAKLHFSNGHYEACITSLSALDEGNKAYDEAQLLLGYSYLKLNQPILAFQVFTKVKNTQQIDKDRTEWHIVLAHLQSDHMDHVCQHLDQIIANPRHDYFVEAHQLKSCLDSVWRKFVF